jgi:hypothetical protein
MKKVTLILPDTITLMRGSGRASEKVELDTNQENLISALTCDDYHLTYFYEKPEEIKVVSVEVLKS